MIKLFENKAEITLEPKTVNITYTENLIIKTLSKNYPKVTTFEELVKLIWNNELDEDYLSALRVHIARLRGKGIRIETVNKRGYILNDKVEETNELYRL